MNDEELALMLSLEEFEEQNVLVSQKDVEIEHKKSVNKQNDETISLIDPVWETIDPIPDIHSMFIAYDDRFFSGKLKAVEVRWSPRMTLCAGLCVYQGRSGMCSIRLSQALLKFRPRKDLVETLLHEMIHAYLFVTNNDRDRDGHGPNFQRHMNRINAEAGTKITIYHSFHAEVDNYKVHWWRCDGPCQKKRPFYGFVKRSMNRAPGPNDNWWKEHSFTCGGTFTKVKEPADYKSKKSKKNSQFEQKSLISHEKSIVVNDKTPVKNSKNQPDISKFFTPSPKEKKSIVSEDTDTNLPSTSYVFPGTGVRLGFKSESEKSKVPLQSYLPSTSAFDTSLKRPNDEPIEKTLANGSKKSFKFSPVKKSIFQNKNHMSENNNSVKREIFNDQIFSANDHNIMPKDTQNFIDFVTCPVCNSNVESKDINAHLDICLTK